MSFHANHWLDFDMFSEREKLNMVLRAEVDNLSRVGPRILSNNRCASDYRGFKNFCKSLSKPPFLFGIDARASSAWQCAKIRTGTAVKAENLME